MDVVIALIGAAGVIGAAIITGMRSQNKATKVLQKMDILGKRTEFIEKNKSDVQRSEKTVDSVVADRLNESINRDIFEMSGSERRGAIASIAALLLFAFGTVVLVQAVAATDDIFKVTLLFASFILIALSAASLYAYMIPDMIERWTRKYYFKFLERSGVAPSKREAAESNVKLERGISRSIKKASVFVSDNDVEAATKAAVSAILSLQSERDDSSSSGTVKRRCTERRG